MKAAAAATMTKKASTAVTLSSSSASDPLVFNSSSSSDGGCPAAEGGYYFDQCGVTHYFLSGGDNTGDGDGGYGWYNDKRTASAAASNDIDREANDGAGVVDKNRGGEVNRKLLGFFKEIEPADIDDSIDCGHHLCHDSNCNKSSSSSRPMTMTTMTTTADATTSPTAAAKTTSAIRTLLKQRRQSATTRQSKNNTQQSQITTTLAYTEDAIIVGNTLSIQQQQQQQQQQQPSPPQSLSLSSPLSACYPEYYYYYSNNGNGGAGGNGSGPLLEPIDFDPSTWLDAIRQTIVSSAAVRYGATAAAALTAAIVVHPIAIIGAGGIIAGTLLWAVGYYHDASADDISHYKLWQGGEEVFGRLFWSENETETTAAADGSDEDDVVKVVEIDEIGMTRLVEESHNSNNNNGEGNSINDNYNNNNIKNDEGFVAAVAGFFSGGTWSTSEQKRLIMKQSQIKDNDEEERRGVVTVVKLNEKEEEERGVDDASISLTTIMTTRTPPGKKKIISTATIKRNARERIRRIRSAPTKDIFVSVTEVRPDTPPSNAVDDAVNNNMPSVDRVSSSIPTIKTATTIHVIPDDDDDDDSNNNINNNDEQRLNNNVIDTHFPPLEVCVMESVKLVGLNSATQFFDVFFADDAPYSMRDFQKKRGDVDVVYGKWEDCLVEEGRDNTTTTLSPRIEEGEGGGDASLLYSVKEGANVIPLPPNSTRQRTLQFNTLTKSYFGPAYAKATKVQRATLLSSNQLLVIENVTHLSDIPYADRFRVIERWVLEVVEGGGNEDIITLNNNENGNNSTKQRLSLVGRSQSFGPTSSSSDGQNNITTNACCKLTVHAEVQMLQPCSWEAQIRKKASETFTEVVQDWCKSATVALAATEEQMRKRLRVVSLSDVIRNEQQQGSIDGKVAERRVPPSPAMIMTQHRSVSLARGRSYLLAIHKRNFDQLEKRVANGDLEWCSIEVMHSSPVCVRKDGRSSGVVESTTLSSEYATVLEYPSLSLNDYDTLTFPMNNNADDDVKMARFTSQRKVAAAVLMRTRSSKLFKKLSSRRRTSNDKQSTG